MFICAVYFVWYQTAILTPCVGRSSAATVLTVTPGGTVLRNLKIWMNLCFCDPINNFNIMNRACTTPYFQAHSYYHTQIVYIGLISRGTVEYNVRRRPLPSWTTTYQPLRSFFGLQQHSFNTLCHYLVSMKFPSAQYSTGSFLPFWLRYWLRP